MPLVSRILTRIVGVALSPAVAGVRDEEVTEEDGGGVQVFVLESRGCFDVVVVLLRDGQHPGVQLNTGKTQKNQTQADQHK